MSDISKDSDQDIGHSQRISRRSLVAGAAVAGAVVAGGAAAAHAQSAPKSSVRFVQPDTMVKTPSYTHVVEVISPGKVIYTSGERGGDKDGKIPPDIRGQSWQALENIRLNLAAVGATFEHVVKINVYMMDLRRDHSTWSEVKQTFVNKAAPPASTTVQVAQLTRDGVLVEVDVVAVVPA